MEAPTDEDAKGMDDDEDDGDGGDEIPGTQDDPLSLPILVLVESRWRSPTMKQLTLMTRYEVPISYRFSRDV